MEPIVSINYVVEGDTNSVVMVGSDGVSYYTSIDHELVVQWLADGHTIGPAPVIIPPPYTIGADLPWARMTDEEADLVQAGIDAAPIKTRNMINKATSFTQDTDAFNKFKAIITAAINATRAGEILAPMSAEEAAAAPEVV